jgi:hypothetical protein
VKEKFMKGSEIADIASHEKFARGIPDRRDYKSEREVLRKRLLNSRGLRESLDPTLKGHPTERPETTSCGLDPTLKGHPTERPETTTSCGLDPTLKGHPTKGAETTESCALESLNISASDFHEKTYEIANNLFSCENKLAQ